ncbi:MAG: hypothetical protein EZS28_037708 [Streblomastix strix]|uniref:Uncharacterized protein n=1 Tax=Streblomastix strix TaxID=222440 RepID=A0A5J4U970_9EUKA|nr:MAG: hypothetical protein EZS28_037708 [Streblomastix strix]
MDITEYLYKPLTDKQIDLINEMQQIGTARQLRYFLSQHEDLYEIGTLALNKAINVKGYKISRRNDKFQERANNYRDYIYQISSDGSQLSRQEREKGYIQRAFMETIMDLSDGKINQEQAAIQLQYYIDESRQLDEQGKLRWVSPQ